MNQSSTVTAPSAGTGKPGARWLALLLLGLGAALFYAQALGFGLFNDDPTGNLAWLDQRSLFGIFTSASGYGFYRPAGFAVWKLMYLALGAHNAVALHAVSILFHALNTVGVWLLAQRLTRRQPAAWAAAIIFALAPFSYEAVLYVAALFHPLLTFWVLAGLLSYDLGRRTGRSGIWLVTFICALAALFTHENGVALIGLLVLWELLFATPVGRRRAIAFLAGLLLTTAAFLLVWLRMQTDLGSRSHAMTETVANALTFLQAIAAPFLPYVRLTVSQPALLALLAALTVVIAGLSAWRTHLVRVYLFALLWIAGTAAPTILFLPYEYVQGSPRLFYLTYVGVALLWSLPFVALARALRPVALAAVVLLALLAAIVAPPVAFANCEMALYRDGSAVIREMARLTSRADPAATPVFVNLPIYFKESPAAPKGCSTAYPWVHNGAIILPTYVNLRDVSRLNHGADRPASGVSISAFDAIWPPRYGEPREVAALRDLMAQGPVHVFDDKTWSFFPLSDMWDIGSQPPAGFEVILGEELGLEGVSVEQNNRTVTVTSRWRMLAAPRPLTAFAHIYNADGQLVAQSDAPLGQSGARLLYAAFELRQPGDLIVDRHTIELPRDLPSGQYTAAVGVYDPATVQRLTARAADGTALANDLVVAGHVIVP